MSLGKGFVQEVLMKKRNATDGRENPKGINVKNLETLLVSHSSAIPVPQRGRCRDLKDKRNRLPANQNSKNLFNGRLKVRN